MTTFLNSLKKVFDWKVDNVEIIYFSGQKIIIRKLREKDDGWIGGGRKCR